MKIQIGVGITPLSGTLNIDPSQPNNPDCTAGDFRNLDHYCGRSECTELIGETVLDNIPPVMLTQVLQNWAGKLRHGGIIRIGGTDLLELCKAVTYGHITLQDASFALYGDIRNVWSMKYGQYSSLDVVNLLKQLGLKIVKVRLNGFQMVVEAVRE